MKSLRRFLLGSLVLVILSSIASFSAPLTASQQQQVAVLAEYMTGPVDNSGNLLLKHGYTPTVDPAMWQRWPAYRKIETACLEAENAEPRAGAQKLLALLTQDLATKNSAVLEEVSLRPYRAKSGSFVSVTFKAIKPGDQVPELPSSITKAVDTLSQYCSHGPFGSPQTILQRDFGLTADQSYDILRQSGGTPEAFKRAMNYVPEQERIATLQKLYERVVHKYEAARYEPDLSMFTRDNLPPTSHASSSPPFGSPDSGSGFGSGFETPPARPEVPVRPQNMPSASERYTPFVEEHYSSAPAAMEFIEMAGAVEGFGGIVFGNSVQAAKNLPPITQITYAAGPAPQTGQLQVRLKNGNDLTYEGVSPEEAYAAYRMVYTGAESVPALVLGKGVGLVGLTDRQVNVTCNASTLKMDEGSLFNIVLHPALSNTNTGWAAVMVDALPINVPILLAQMRAGGADDDALASTKALFESMQTKAFLHNWKVVDVPMTVSSEGNKIVVIRSEGEFPIGLKRSAFIEMRPMERGGTFNSEFAGDFYRQVPILATSSPDYFEMNRFAAVLALVRLAKAEKAAFPQPNKPATTVSTPDAILIADKSIMPAVPSSVSRSLTTSLRVLNGCLDDTMRLYPQVRDVLSSIATLESKRDAQLNLAKRAAKGSPQERQAKATAKQLGQQIDATLHKVDLDLPEWAFTLDLLDLDDALQEYIDDLQR